MTREACHTRYTMAHLMGNSKVSPMGHPMAFVIHSAPHGPPRCVRHGACHGVPHGKSVESLMGLHGESRGEPCCAPRGTHRVSHGETMGSPRGWSWGCSVTYSMVSRIVLHGFTHGLPRRLSIRVAHGLSYGAMVKHGLVRISHGASKYCTGTADH